MRTTDRDIFAREGLPLCALSAILVPVGFWLNAWAGLTGLAWLAFCLYFFRNPRRSAAPAAGSILCPADGKVVFLGEAVEKQFLHRPMGRLSVFMSPVDVHVNRSPADGTVVDTSYYRGRFLAAFNERAASENERAAVRLRLDDGGDMVFVQVAGWFARRIVSYVQAGDRLGRGGIFGLIKFGSRMDVYLPDGYEWTVALGERVKAGETVIARRMPS